MKIVQWWILWSATHHSAGQLCQRRLPSGTFMGRCWGRNEMRSGPDHVGRRSKISVAAVNAEVLDKNWALFPIDTWIIAFSIHLFCKTHPEYEVCNLLALTNQILALLIVLSNIYWNYSCWSHPGQLSRARTAECHPHPQRLLPGHIRSLQGHVWYPPALQKRSQAFQRSFKRYFWFLLENWN